MKSLDSAQTEQLYRSLVLPADVEIVEYLGSGGRSHVFRARFEDQDVVVKVYRDEAVAKYARRYGVDIAQFEYDRNLALYRIDSLRNHIARPYKVYPRDESYSQAMVQEHIGGKPLGDLIKQLGYLPPELLESGYRVIRTAEAAGIHDLDISTRNVRVIEDGGNWVLKLYDFNLMPQHLAPPNPFLGLAIKLGLRRKSHRDYRNLRKWEWRGQKVQNVAAK